MDGAPAKKSNSLETLVIQNITNANELKTKLHEIINAGKDYEYDVSACMKSLLRSSDREIILLTIQAISELAKCEEKRETYSNRDIIEPILSITRKEVTLDTAELIKQCCRALGNLCCDCDAARKIILDDNGILTLESLLRKTVDDKSAYATQLRMFTSKALLNFAIGGQEFSEPIAQSSLVELLHKILTTELEKDDMSDEMVSTALLILNVMNENTPEFQFEPELNTAVLNVLKETANVEISELCLDHLHSQAEHDSVKTLLANEKGVQLVCKRLEHLVEQHEAGVVNTEDTEVEAVMKQACDLVIIVLTGVTILCFHRTDEAMHILYSNGTGEVYTTVVQWLDSPNQHLLTTAVLAIGNFARQDDYCAKMMEDRIFDKLLDIFETYHTHGLNIQKDAESQPITAATVTKVQHAVLSALRNLTVPVANKRKAASQGRAAPILLNALPSVEDHHVAYKLLAAIRMLVDGQEEVAVQLASNEAALAAVARWGHCGHYAGAAGEAPRLLAWAARRLPRALCPRLVQVEGCVSSLVNMLVVCHSVMQNEAILALTLLAIEALKPQSEQDFDNEKSFIAQLIKSEIGKHVSVLIDTNCAKMPVEVAENLLAFLDITCKKNKLALDYKEATVHEALQKFMETRNDFSDDLKSCILNVITVIADGKMEVIE